MKFHLGSISNYAHTSISVDHVTPTGPLTIEDLRKRKEHNQAILEIASTLSYVEYDDIKDCDTGYKVWETL